MDITVNTDSLLGKLTAIVGQAGVLSAKQLVGRSASVWSGGELKALALIRPGSTDEVSQVLKFCNDVGQAVVPVGGMSGLAGGHMSTGSDIMLSLERMNKIESINGQGRTMTVQAGTILQAVQERAADSGLMFPLDLGARASCTIGGNIATNAGGVRVLRYGMMRDLVLGLEVVLADGTIISSMSGLMKNNTGYDIRQYFPGSEGTLGVVTRAILRLYEAPAGVETALLAVSSWDHVMGLLRYLDAALAGRLVAFEVLWRNYYELNTGQFSDLAPPLSATAPYYILIDVLASDIEKSRAELEALIMTCLEQNQVVDAILANSESERLKIWQIRENFDPVRRKYPLHYSYDISLPIHAMEDYIESARAQLTRRFQEAELFAYGHVGDGNLHLFVIPGAENRHDDVDEIIYGSLRNRGGSISAEHGIGLDKKRFLAYSRSEAEIDLMRRMKAMMDPRNILNPGKLFD